MAEQTVTRFRDLGKRTDMVNMEPSIIRIEKGHNCRDYRLTENREHLDSLKLSIAKVGVRIPLLVRMEGDQPVLVDGECRLRACLELIKEGHDLKRVPTISVTANNEAERLMISMETNTGKSLSTWEAGTGFKRLVGFGWTVDEIAARFGSTVGYVNKAIELSDAPEEVKQQLSEQAITPAFAIKAVRKARGDSAKAVAEVKEAVAKNKAAGNKTPVKAAKAKHTNPFDDLCRKIISQALKDGDFGVSTIDELVSLKKGELGFDFVSVSADLMLKMAKLVAS